MSFVPKYAFFVKGKGYHKAEFGSFEEALRNAGIAQFNLVPVSSIFPPHCKEISIEDGLAQLNTWQILFVVMCRTSSNRLEDMVSASIALVLFSLV